MKNLTMEKILSDIELEEQFKLHPPPPIPKRHLALITECFVKAVSNFYEKNPDLKKKIDRHIRYEKSKSSKK